MEKFNFRIDRPEYDLIGKCQNRLFVLMQIERLYDSCESQSGLYTADIKDLPRVLDQTL